MNKETDKEVTAVFLSLYLPTGGRGNAAGGACSSAALLKRPTALVAGAPYSLPVGFAWTHGWSPERVGLWWRRGRGVVVPLNAERPKVPVLRAPWTSPRSLRRRRD